MGLFPNTPSDSSSLVCRNAAGLSALASALRLHCIFVVLMLLLWGLWSLWLGCCLHVVCCMSVPMQMPSRVCFLPLRSGQNFWYLGVSLSHMLLSTYTGTRLLSLDGVLALWGIEPLTHRREVLVPVPCSPRGPALGHVSQGSV